MTNYINASGGGIGGGSALLVKSSPPNAGVQIQADGQPLPENTQAGSGGGIGGGSSQPSN